jgi:hypothetical protein
LENLVSFSAKNCEQLASESIENICKNAPNLTSLNISGCKKIDGLAADMVCTFMKIILTLKIAKYCKRMQNLNLRGCWRINDVSLINLFANCIYLRYIFHSFRLNVRTLKLDGIKGVNDKVLDAISKNLSNSIQNLYLKSCMIFSQKALCALTST